MSDEADVNEMEGGRTRRAFLRTLARGSLFVPPAMVTLNVSRARGQGPQASPPGHDCPPGTRWDPQLEKCVTGAQAKTGVEGGPFTRDPASRGSDRDGGPPPPWRRPPPR